MELATYSPTQTVPAATSLNGRTAFTSAGHATIWVGAFVALSMTSAAASADGYDASRFNRTGILYAAFILAAAGVLFVAGWLTKADRQPATR